MLPEGYGFVVDHLSYAMHALRRKMNIFEMITKTRYISTVRHSRKDRSSENGRNIDDTDQNSPVASQKWVIYYAQWGIQRMMRLGICEE